jgi:hypothetical protein
MARRSNRSVLHNKPRISLLLGVSLRALSRGPLNISRAPSVKFHRSSCMPSTINYLLEVAKPDHITRLKEHINLTFLMHAWVSTRMPPGFSNKITAKSRTSTNNLKLWTLCHPALVMKTTESIGLIAMADPATGVGNVLQTILLTRKCKGPTLQIRIVKQTTK